MKKTITILVLFIGVIVISYSCQDTLNNLPTEKCIIENALTVEEAKAFFNSHQLSALITRSIDDVKECLLPGDYSPNWEQAVPSSNKNISNIDIPILPQYKYRVVRCKMNNGVARAYTVNITQKIVVSKNLENNKLGLYHITLIPDNSYYKKNKGDISSHFISHGDKNNYSGLVIYSLPQIKKPVKLEKYVSGEKIFSMLIPATTKERTYLKMSIFNRLMDNMKFAVSQSVAQTRFGEYDSFWEWFEEEVFPDAEDGDRYTMEQDGEGWYLDDGEGGRIDIPDDLVDDEELDNDWFEPGNWSPHDDFDNSDDFNSGEADVNYEFGPWLQVYHKSCGQLLMVANWNDWDGGALYCSKCRKSVTDFVYTYSYY
ncbi:hypothetical protein [uncultured Bacteroides sp.]|uniref:hypothetical protein n=1 Tax=uncultured Bacteroides sp. TaxID=162156 RepID=UPI0025E1B4A7|nr:hypothetical protein [uncultured Bacteroides sp.]